MNKPETKSAQSLEEILASIRKALAEEEVQGGPEAPASAEPARPADKPAEKKTSPAAKADPLPGQLSVALNGSGTGQNATDDDLADLLAPLPSQAASAAAGAAEPSPPQSDDKDKSEDKDKKDPLWFLARKDAPESEPAVGEVKQADKPGGREDATPKPADSTLTRLETLRSSLPPLFGVEETAAAKAEPVNYVQPAPSPKPADLPEFAPPRKAKEEKLETKPEIKAPPAEKAPAAQAMGSELPTPDPMPPPSGGVPHPPAGAAPPVEAVAALSDPRQGASKASPLGSDQARALEAMIGQLIGPVIHGWLDANLPRLVEKVVREEVARIGKKPDVGKD